MKNKAREAFADSVSDALVDVLNAKIKDPELDPLGLLAGQCLALLALGNTAPPNTPRDFKRLMQAANDCVRAISERL